jgi:hypothetical protein
MKITKKEHKALIYTMFFREEQGQVRPVNFAIDKLVDASSAAKKVKPKDSKFIDGEVEFTADEWVILKELFEAKTEWAWGDADSVVELKELFEGK